MAIPPFKPTESFAYDLIAQCLHTHLERARPFFERNAIVFSDDLRATAGATILHAGVEKAFSVLCILCYFVGDVPADWISVGNDGLGTQYGSLVCRRDFGQKLDLLRKLGLFPDLELFGADEGTTIPDPRVTTLDFLQEARNDFIHFGRIEAGISLEAGTRELTIEGITSDYTDGTCYSRISIFEQMFGWLCERIDEFVKANRIDDILLAIDQEVEEQQRDLAYVKQYAEKVSWNENQVRIKINAVNSRIFADKWQPLLERARARMART